MGPDETPEPAGDDAQARPSPADDVPGAGSTTATGLRVLLVYATRHGSTREVADAVAEELRAAGHDVDQQPAAEAPGPVGYDAVVVGGPMIMGWHREAVRFVAKHRKELAELPLAFFITAASLTDCGETDVQGVPIVKDPWLEKAPRNAAKLRSKERYARPRAVAFFAGSLD